ncbi:MAG: class I SAM-dependent methyltransferase [Phycisphaerae bacterium]
MPSATVPTGNQSESDVLDVRAEVWKKRPLLREIYNRYFAEMAANFAVSGSGEGRFGTIVEIGGGSGNFKEYFAQHHRGEGRLIATDVVPTHHCDLAVDAMAMPFGAGSVDNIVMQDVLHHVPYPLRFFAEAERVLRVGGRVVMTEPYISPASRVVFGLAHPEPVVMSAEIFGDSIATDPSPLRGSGAFGSNQATPTRLFFRDRAKFEARFPRLHVLSLHRRSLFVYPLSGGFSGPKLLPRFLETLGWGMEALLKPASSLLAFRLLAVIEKK